MTVLDLLIWLLLACSVAYVAVFSIASALRGKRRSAASHEPRQSFLVIIPAYREDNVIRGCVEAMLRQTYPTHLFRTVVVSDHMQQATDEWLSSVPVTLLRPQFDKSSKARALQFAVKSMQAEGASFTNAVVLDADNIVQPDFLERLNNVITECGYRAIQCHRTAKNSDGSVAMLDGVSEEINNSIFRRGHNAVGLSSALIGSGMCFDYGWFSTAVTKLDSAVEDREFEALLTGQNIFIYYAEDIIVLDEKVSNESNFQRQRQRWLTGQAQTLLRMLPKLPSALRHANWDYADKTLQQALVPRSLLIVLTFAAAVIVSIFAPAYCLKWWLLCAVLWLSLLLAVPRRLLGRSLLRSIVALPRLAWHMLVGICRIRISNKDFLHTDHTVS